MNVIRERILIDTENSRKNYPFSEHRDLISFCVCSEYFEYWEDENFEEMADFNEVLAVVDKDWLFKYMEVENPLKYLQEEYTSDDSIDWFLEASNTGHLAMIEFC